MKNNNSLGTFIKSERERKGLSQRELSRRANMDCSELSRIESGQRLKPNVLYLKSIADILDLSMVDLMKLAGYSDTDINFGKDLFNKRSNKDYENQIKSHEQFYYDILDELENRRKIDFAIKGGIADLIDKIKLAIVENKEIPNNEILERLEELIPMIRPNLEKIDKSKYPTIDTGIIHNTKK